MPGIRAIVDGAPQGRGQDGVGIGAVAAGIGEVTAADAGLHAADETVIAGVLQGDAPAHQGLFRQGVPFEAGHAAHLLGGLDAGLP